MQLCFMLVVLLESVRSVSSTSLHHDAAELQQLESSYYYSTTDSSILGASNKRAVLDNPMKGLLTSPRYTGYNTPNTIPSTLEFYYIGLSELMTGPNTFNWSVLDDALARSEAQNKHIILRVFCHFPGQSLQVPKFLLQMGIQMRTLKDGERSPQYDDPILLKAFGQFIAALGAKYDGHKALAFIQLGLLGKWGEWHTFPDDDLISNITKDTVVAWFANSFNVTRLQVSYPMPSAYAAGIGYHDDSFGYSTLDGAANGGKKVEWFFWPQIQQFKQEDFWKTSVMGGETRPELQHKIFKKYYRAPSNFKQKFMECVTTTHATYIFHHNAFMNGALLKGKELENALNAHINLGYSYEVTKVAVTSPSNGKVSIDVTVKQTGVAPFYYPLNLVVSCSGAKKSMKGVETLSIPGDIKIFRFSAIPNTVDCLNNIEISLDSAYAHVGRPVRFAQGTDGRVMLNIPMSGEETVSGAQSTQSRNSPFKSLPTTRKNGIIFVDAGIENEDLSTISGNFSQSYRAVSITNTGKYGQEAFQSQLLGSEFTYTFKDLKPASSKKITIGFAETLIDACKEGGRVMEINVNGILFASSLDVFSKAGCATVFFLTDSFEVNSQGRIDISFKGLKEDAMVSLIVIQDAPFWIYLFNLLKYLLLGDDSGKSNG